MTAINSKLTLFVGHYGSGNYGDDIMLFELVTRARESNKKIAVIFFNSYTDGFGLQEEEIVRIDRRNKLRFLYDYLCLLPKCCEIVWGGGTCFTDEEGDGFFLGMILAYIFRLNIKYVSIGVGKLTRVSRLIKARVLFRLAESISFRDCDSIKMANQLAPALDFAFEKDLGLVHLEKINSDKKMVSGGYLLLAWRDLTDYGLGYEVLNRVADFAINESKAINVKKIVIMNTDNCVDHEVGDSLYSLMVNVPGFDVQLSNASQFNEKSKIILGAEKIITSRLHVLIAGVVFGKKVDVYSYSPKIDSVLQQACVGVRRINKLI